MKKFLFALIATCQIIFISNSIFAQALNVSIAEKNKENVESLFDKKLSNTYYSILNDRISMKMPEGSENIPIQESIMASVSSNDEETRLVAESQNGELLVVYAQEMFMYSTGNLKEDAKNLWEEMSGQTEKDYELSETKNNKDLNVVKVDLKNIPEDGDAFLINGAFVRTSDNGLIFVSVYANSNALSEKEKCLKLSNDLISTIKTGNRKLNLSERKETISNINVDVKKDYILTSKSGADYDVLYIKKMVPIDKNSPYMGIYLGSHPSFSEELQEYNESELTKTEATILGNKIEWLYYSKNSENVDETSYMQTLIDTKKDNYARYIHIFIYPTNDNDLNEMKEIAETLKYAKN